MVLRWMNSLAPRTGSHHLSPVSEATPTPLASPLPTPQPEGHQVTPTICSGPRSGPCTGSGTQTSDSGGDGSLSCTRGSQGTRRQNPPGTQALSLVHAQRQGEFCRQLPQEVPSRGETRACLQGPHGEGETSGPRRLGPPCPLLLHGCLLLGRGPSLPGFPALTPGALGALGPLVPSPDACGAIEGREQAGLWPPAPPGPELEVGPQLTGKQAPGTRSRGAGT